MMCWVNSLPDFFVLFCFLNSTQVTTIEEWIRMQTTGLISLISMFECFQKVPVCKCSWGEGNLPLS